MSNALTPARVTAVLHPLIERLRTGDWDRRSPQELADAIAAHLHDVTVLFGDVEPAPALQQQPQQPQQQPPVVEPEPEVPTDPNAPKSCPFCGHVGLNFGEGKTHRWLKYTCGSCEIGGEIRIQTRGDGSPEQWHADAKIAAVKQWNTRMPYDWKSDALEESHA